MSEKSLNSNKMRTLESLKNISFFECDETEVVTPRKNLECLDGFRNALSVKKESVAKFPRMRKESSSDEVGIQLIYYAANIVIQFNLVEFKHKKLPIIASSIEYSTVYEKDTKSRLREVSERLDSSDVELLDLKAREAQLVVKESDYLSRIAELKENPALVSRPRSVMREYNVDSDRVVARLMEIRRSLRENERLQGELREKFRDEMEKSRLQAVAHFEREQLALSRAKEAVNDFFSVIEDIVAQYPMLLALLSKRQLDPRYPSDDPANHFEARHLWMFFAVMEERFLNVDDDLSAMADFMRAANPQREFADDTQLANYYLEVVRILKSKGIETVSVENMMAINIILHVTPAKRAEFLKRRQLKRDMQRGPNGSDHGSVCDEGTWMEQVIHYLDQLESAKHQEESLMSAGASVEVFSAGGAVQYCHEFQRGVCMRGVNCRFVHKKDPTFSPMSARRGAEDEKGLRKNHATVFAASAGACRDFLNGRCKYGDNCIYSHEPKQGQGVPQQRAVHFASPVPGIVKIPAAVMWDITGWKCCWKGPYFIEHSDGPCPHPYACPYSHDAPVTAVKPHNAH